MAGPVSAGFLGHEMQMDWRFPDFNTVLETHTFLVSDATEFPLGSLQNSSVLQIDLTNNQIAFEIN